MTESQHRRGKRKRGVRVTSGSGRRRASGAVDAQAAPSREAAARERRRLRRQARRKIGGAVVLAAVIVYGAVYLTSRIRTDAEPETAASIEPVTAEGASILLAVFGPDGEARSIALLAASEGATPRLILLPPSLLTVIPGFGENVIGNASRFGGLETLELTVANLLGARIDAAAGWEAADFASLIGGPLPVEIDKPLLAEDGDAQVVVAGPGLADRSPDQLVRLLTDAGTDDEITWLTRQGAVWQAILTASDTETLRRLAQGATGDLVAAQATLGAAADEAAATVVPVTRIEPTGGEERYQLSGEIAAEFVSQTVPYLALAPEPRVRVEVLNGNGRIGAVRPVAAALIRTGFRVILTDNADRLDYPETRIIAQGREHQEAAIGVQRILGLGQVSVEVRQPSGVVDLTIIVGQDLATDGG